MPERELNTVVKSALVLLAAVSAEDFSETDLRAVEVAIEMVERELEEKKREVQHQQAA